MCVSVGLHSLIFQAQHLEKIVSSFSLFLFLSFSFLCFSPIYIYILTTAKQSSAHFKKHSEGSFSSFFLFLSSTEYLLVFYFLSSVSEKKLTDKNFSFFFSGKLSDGSLYICLSQLLFPFQRRHEVRQRKLFIKFKMYIK